MLECIHLSDLLEARLNEALAADAFACPVSAVCLYWMWRRGSITSNWNSSVRTRDSLEQAMVCSQITEYLSAC
jgi:hypothetical protein